MSFNQETRELAVSSHLGNDIFYLSALRGEERLSELFEYQLDLLSETRERIRHQDMLGRPMTARLALPNGQTRYFNGIVRRFTYTGATGKFARFSTYRAILVPRIWRLSQTTDCRIFQHMTAPDIVREVCRDHGYTHFQECLRHPYERRKYCVQYQETALAFIRRLLEQEGISFFFRHEEHRHLMVLDDATYYAHRPVPGYEEIPYYPPDDTAQREDHIDDLSITGEVQSGAFTHKDFDYEAPRKRLVTGKNDHHERARTSLERYEYPGGYTQYEQGERWARARIEELHVGYETIHGTGNARGLAAGARFKLTGYPYPNEDLNRDYLIVSTAIAAKSNACASAAMEELDDIGATATFRCEFSVLDFHTPYRPPRITPKPVIQGTQTAIVTGPAGQEIWTDQYGRVFVQFHWDRRGQFNEHSSCRVRVSQPWAGKGWGALAVPRIGQEVVVSFTDGDPDRPIIIGSVYNGVNRPPHGLPLGAAISGLRSESTPGGGGYNEYVIDDTKDRELIREHGQFNKESTIRHDLYEQVGNNRSREVTNDETIQIGNDRTKTVTNDETINIGGNLSYNIGGDLDYNVGGDVRLKAGGAVFIEAPNIIIEGRDSITARVGSGHLVVDRTGTTHSNSPHSAPVINASSPPLSWLGEPEKSALTDEKPQARLRLRTIRKLCEEKPIAGAEVTLVDKNQTLKLKTDSDGYVDFPGLKKRTYPVKIEHEDFKTKHLLVAAKSDDNRREIVLEPEWDLTLIPDIMRHNNWPVAAQLMEHWFSRDAYEYPDSEDLDYAKIPHNDRIVTLEWALNFDRARNLYDAMWNEPVYVIDPAKDKIKEMLERAGKFTDKRETFGDLEQPVAVINEKYYFLNKRLTKPPLLLDDMVAALSRFAFRMAFQAEVIPQVPGVYTVHLQKVGIYIRDSFSFETDQPLGSWNPDDNLVRPTPRTLHWVENRDFREWREENGCGGDFIVFSDIETRDVNESWRVEI